MAKWRNNSGLNSYLVKRIFVDYLFFENPVFLGCSESSIGFLDAHFIFSGNCVHSPITESVSTSEVVLSLHYICIISPPLMGLVNNAPLCSCRNLRINDKLERLFSDGNTNVMGNLLFIRFFFYLSTGFIYCFYFDRRRFLLNFTQNRDSFCFCPLFVFLTCFTIFIFRL